MTNPKAQLFFKILQVQQILQPLEKSGHNDFHRYSYATAGDVLLPVKEVCNAHGLIVVADCIDSKIEPGRASCTVRLTVADSETGESLSITAPGYAEDWSYKDNRPSGDKAIYKAITGATKYAVRSFFCLPSEDDPEQHTPKPAVTYGKGNDTLIEKTTYEMRRLNWSTEQGRAYLEKQFGKSSRQALSQKELQQFLTHLRSLPSAVPAH